MINLYRGPSRDAYYQISIHLAKRFQRRKFFRNQPIRNKNCLCFLPSFGSFGQAVSEEKILNQPIRNKNCLWMPCLLVNRDEMSILYRGPSIDASCQVSVHLTKRFHRRRFKKIVLSETRIACGGHVC